MGCCIVVTMVTDLRVIDRNLKYQAVTMRLFSPKSFIGDF